MSKHFVEKIYIISADRRQLGADTNTTRTIFAHDTFFYICMYTYFSSIRKQHTHTHPCDAYWSAAVFARHSNKKVIIRWFSGDDMILFVFYTSQGKNKKKKIIQSFCFRESDSQKKFGELWRQHFRAYLFVNVSNLFVHLISVHRFRLNVEYRAITARII